MDAVPARPARPDGRVPGARPGLRRAGLARGVRRADGVPPTSSPRPTSSPSTLPLGHGWPRDVGPGPGAAVEHRPRTCRLGHRRRRGAGQRQQRAARVPAATSVRAAPRSTGSRPSTSASSAPSACSRRMPSCRRSAELGTVITLLVISFFLTLALNPLVEALTRRTMRRGWAVTIVFLGVLAVFTLVGWVVIPPGGPAGAASSRRTRHGCFDNLLGQPVGAGRRPPLPARRSASRRRSTSASPTATCGPASSGASSTPARSSRPASSAG